MLTVLLDSVIHDAFDELLGQLEEVAVVAFSFSLTGGARRLWRARNASVVEGIRIVRLQQDRRAAILQRSL
jgi:hypothetical protein